MLIVGGSSGLGSHISKLYLKKKYKVTTISRNINPKFSKKIKQVICDVSVQDQVKKVLERFKKQKIYFDILIHNVGGSKKVYNYDVTSYEYNKVWENNLGYLIDINNFFTIYEKKKVGKNCTRFVISFL